MAAGDEDAVEKIRSLLDVIGRRTWVLGEDPKQANAAKIAGNMMMATAIEAIAEALALAAGNGVAPGDFAGLILDTLSLPLLDAVCARMAEAVEFGLADKDWSAIGDYALHS